MRSRESSSAITGRYPDFNVTKAVAGEYRSGPRFGATAKPSILIAGVAIGQLQLAPTHHRDLDTVARLAERLEPGASETAALMPASDVALSALASPPGTTAYTNVYYSASVGVPVPCSYVGAQVTYSYGGNLYNATRSDATHHNWATSAPSGSNRLIVGSTFFATRPGYYNYSTSSGAIGC